VKELVSLLPLLLILGLFWLLAIRPQQRRNAALAQLQSSLEIGDEVMLSSGFIGTVRGFDDDRVQLELADGVVVQVVRGAVNRVVEPVALPVDDDGDAATTSTEEG
jgi:preprotein translocase subunit YajC